MSKKHYNNVYQFKVTLKNVSPPIWRRLQVPENYSFWDLHVAIQDAFGWLDYHLHGFETINKDYSQVKRIGIPDIEGMDLEMLSGWEENISDWFSLDKNKAMNYTYDFGDDWDHRVELEKIIPREKDIDYPVCINGKRACPPEDCGGIGGYEDKLEVLKNKQHPEYDDVAEWMGDFDQEEFDCNTIVFDDPKERLKNSSLLEQVSNVNKLEKNTKQAQKEKADAKMVLEIDYEEIDFDLLDENGNKIKPLLLIIVHLESYFVLGHHLASPESDYLQQFSKVILDVIKNSSFSPNKVLVKKKELFDVLKSGLKEMKIELEMTKRTKAIESVKKDMSKMFKR